MSKRKWIRGGMERPQIRIVSGEVRVLVCECGHAMDKCVVSHCKLPAHSWTVQEVAAMEEKLARLEAFCRDEPTDYTSGTHSLIERIKAILEDKDGK